MDNVRAILSPLLLTSYVFGIRIIEFPEGKPRLWCSLLYMLLLWSIYYFLWWYTIVYYIMRRYNIFTYLFFLKNSIALSSVVLGIYYDKKYRTCLMKLVIVDNTLDKIGTKTDYQKLYMKMLLCVFVWFVYIICIASINTLWHRDHYSATYSFYICIMFQYPTYINVLDDMVITRTFGYIEMKFEQLNEYLRKLDGYNEHEMKRNWQHPMLLLCQTKYPKSMRSEYVTWVVIHLHLELCKISRVLNSIFGIQMTMKMVLHFIHIAICISELFNKLFIENYDQQTTLFMIVNITELILNTFRLFLINYICEKITVKANATGDVINRISYSTLDVITRENISQFLLQLSLTPLKFYGLGLFQFGLKLFCGFSSSISTVIVILVQSHTNT